jgi:hypothetical protein
LDQATFYYLFRRVILLNWRLLSTSLTQLFVHVLSFRRVFFSLSLLLLLLNIIQPVVEIKSLLSFNLFVFKLMLTLFLLGNLTSSLTKFMFCWSATYRLHSCRFYNYLCLNLFIY